jgi:hypothetical protein
MDARLSRLLLLLFLLPLDARASAMLSRLIGAEVAVVVAVVIVVVVVLIVVVATAGEPLALLLALLSESE